MLDYFIAQVKSKLDSDFTQSLINCFLKTHYDILMEDEDLLNKVKVIMEETEKSHAEMEYLINHNICMISHFTGIQMS